MGQKIFGFKRFIGLEKLLGQKQISQKIFWIKKYLGKKNWGKKSFGSKNFWVEKFLGHKNFWDKKMLDPKFFSFEKKKTGRVNPRWRIYDPPLQNSRVKIVLDCC